MKIQTKIILASLLLTAAACLSVPAGAAKEISIESAQPTASSIKRGDMDGDGKPATPKDAMVLARYIAGWDGYDELIHLEAADLDKDGRPATPKDAMILARYIAGWDGYEKYFEEDEPAEEQKCGDNLTWELLSDGTLQITGTGPMWDFSSATPAPWKTDASRIRALSLPEGLTSVGSNAFTDCANLTGALTLPDSVTSIGDSAFDGCSGLRGTLPLPASLKTVGNYAFSDCRNLNGTLTVPGSVVRIGKRAFSGCGITGAAFEGSAPEAGASIFGDRGTSFAVQCEEEFADTFTSSPNYNATYGTWYGYRLTIHSDTPGEEGQVVASGQCGDNLTWTVYDSGLLEISGTGPMWDYESDYQWINGRGVYTTAPWAEYELKSLRLEDGVGTVGNYAYRNCSGFTGSLTIPDSVTSIGYSAFSGCSGFTGSLTIPDSVTSIGQYAFSGCSGFTGSLTIPDSVTSIESYAFYGCSGFTGSLTIPDSVTSIGNYAFQNCSGFTGSLTIPDSVTSIGYYAFQNCSGFTGSLTIPDSVTSIGYFAFCDCSGFTGNLTIPDSVTSIEGSAFRNCSGFTGDLTILGSIAWWGSAHTHIYSNAFADCTGFSGNLTIGEGVFSIDENAFSGCSGFTGDLVIPNGYIYQNAFKDCTGFNGSLILGDGVTSIGEYAFSGCTGFTGDLTIGKNVKTIGTRAFENCTGFTGTLTLPAALTTIEGYTFYNCPGLTGPLTLPDGVTTIGVRAFSGCSGFTGKLTVPASVTNIRSNAFEGTTGIPSAKFLGDAPSAGDTVFGSRDDSFIVYHLADKADWPAPGERWNGYKTAVVTESTGFKTVPYISGNEIVFTTEQDGQVLMFYTTSSNAIASEDFYSEYKSSKFRDAVSVKGGVPESIFIDSEAKQINRYAVLAFIPADKELNSLNFCCPCIVDMNSGTNMNTTGFESVSISADQTVTFIPSVSGTANLLIVKDGVTSFTGISAHAEAGEQGTVSLAGIPDVVLQMMKGGTCYLQLTSDSGDVYRAYKLFDI